MTNDEANEIIKSFSRTLIQVQKLRLFLCPQAFPQSALEYSKKDIKLALTSVLNYAYLNADNRTADLLKTVMAQLDSFIDDEEAYRQNHRALGRKDYWDLLRKQN